MNTGKRFNEINDILYWCRKAPSVSVSRDGRFCAQSELHLPPSNWPLSMAM